MDAVRAFANGDPCYCGVSWGKDSVVVAHLVRRAAPKIPLVWVRVKPIENPHCVLVRDAFLGAHPGPYTEIEEHCFHDDLGWHATGTLERGFARAAALSGARHVSGVRAQESTARRLRMMTHGESTAMTCAPIGWWSGEHVFAYLSKHDLPVHPAYAMTHGGVLDRIRIRVSSLGGERGTGKGRREWEQTYYRQEIDGLK